MWILYLYILTIDIDGKVTVVTKYSMNFIWPLRAKLLSNQIA